MNKNQSQGGAGRADRIKAQRRRPISQLPTAAQGEDDSPLVVQSAGWETLPNGLHQLRLHCQTMVDYVTLPDDLVFGQMTIYKTEWDSKNRLAYYRQSEDEEDLKRENHPGSRRRNDS